MNREQAIYDLCAPAMLRQGRKSATVYGCRYFAGDGLRCGASPIVRDECKDDNEFIDTYNATPIQHLPQQYIKPEFQNLTYTELLLLKSIQDIHDNQAVHAWGEKLRKLADNFKLGAACLEGVGEEKNE